MQILMIYCHSFRPLKTASLSKKKNDKEFNKQKNQRTDILIILNTMQKIWIKQN